MVWVTLEQEAQMVMQRWADQSDAVAPARPYAVLAAFCLSRSKAKEAAQAHFQHAQRLQAECTPTPPTMALLVEALGARHPLVLWRQSMHIIQLFGNLCDVAYRLQKPGQHADQGDSSGQRLQLNARLPRQVLEDPGNSFGFCFWLSSVLLRLALNVVRRGPDTHRSPAV